MFEIGLELVNGMLQNVVMNKVNTSKIRCMMPRVGTTDEYLGIKIRLCEGRVELTFGCTDVSFKLGWVRVNEGKGEFI